jgi:hypothetical protein
MNDRRLVERIRVRSNVVNVALFCVWIHTALEILGSSSPQRASRHPRGIRIDLNQSAGQFFSRNLLKNPFVMTSWLEHFRR